MIDGMLAIDDHCHFGQPKVERAGVRRFLAEELIARMDRNGIDKTVVCHLIFPLWEPEEFTRGNDLVLEAARKHSERLVPACVINPRQGAFAAQEARRCLGAGAKVIKVHPVLHGFYPISGDVMNPIMAIAEEAGVPVVTHSDFNARSCTPYEVAHLARRFPRVTVVMLHMGIDPEALWHIPEIVAPIPNLMIDSSLTSDIPYGVYVNTVRKLGADRVMFGSDGPIVSVEANLAKLAAAEQNYGLTKDEKRKILGENAARVFRLQ